MKSHSQIRASGRSRKIKSNFAGFSGINSRKKQPISREFLGNFRGQLPEQISLESNWFCTDLRKVFNATRRSYSIYSGFIQEYEIVLYK